MSDTELKHVDPYSINVDEMNERTENLNLGDLEKSVEEQGIIQPPLVRERNGDVEVPYTVVVGQRRVMAAQGVGLDSIPVVVVDWDDTRALESSISENEFREEVSKLDRAKAIERLMELRGASAADVARQIGASPSTVRRWLAPIRDHWEGTPIQESGGTTRQFTADKFSDQTLDTARRLTGDGDEGMLLLERVDELDLSEYDLREIEELVNKGYDLSDAVDKVAGQKPDKSDIRVKVHYTVSNDRAKAIKEIADERGTSESDIAAQALDSYLEREGYL